MATISIIIDKRRQRKDGTYPVCLKFTNINTTAYYATPYGVTASQFRNGRIVNHERASIMNQRLHSLLIQATDSMERTCGFMNKLPASMIRDRTMLAVEGGGAALLIPTFERFIAMKERRSTIESFRYTLSAIQRFSPAADVLTLDSITIEWLCSFEKWLLRSVKRNTCAIHLENLRAVLNFALSEGLTTSYPFARIRIKREASAPRSLSLSDMRSLWHLHPSDTFLAWYLDIFRLSFALCGLNVIDIYNLRKSDINRGRIEINRQKTGTHLSIKITDEARAIIERNAGRKHLVNIADHYRDHKQFLARCNKGLRKLFPSLTTYYARHTWATIAASIGVPVEVISLGLGHRYGSSVTNIYIRHDFALLDAANEKILRAVTE